MAAHRAFIIGFGTAVIAVLNASGGAAQSSDRSAVADPCIALPEPVDAFVARAYGWSMLRLKDLNSDDRALWNASRPNVCPGFASAKMGMGSSPAYAVALLRKTQRGTEEQVVLLIRDKGHVQENILIKPHTVSNPAVVWRVGPGKTRAWDGGPTIDVAYDSIIVETIEATAKQFFFVRGRLRTVVTSD